MQHSISGWFGMTVVALLASASGAAHAAVVEVADCATLIAASGGTHFRLVADVDCSDADDAALLLPPGGRLELRDHTLRGADVRCLGDCRVFGPGTVEGGGVVGSARVVVRRVTVSGSPTDGVVATNPDGNARVTIIDSTITDSAGNGVEFDRRAAVLRSHVVRNGRHGIVVSRRAGNDCARGRITAKASSFHDNGRDGDCGSDEICADVAACTAREAQLRKSTCDHSRQLGSGLPGSACGVCDFD